MYLLDKFESNKYSVWYFDIIDNAARRETTSAYTEKHHIVPRCIGGSDTKSNLITVTAKEHRVLHLLLPKMVIDATQVRKLWHAAYMMCRVSNSVQGRHESKGNLYTIAKQHMSERCSEIHKGKVVSEQSKLLNSISHKGRTHSIETKKKCRDINLGVPKSISHKNKISESRKGKSTRERNGNFGKTWVTNPTTKISKCITILLLEEYIAQGWYRYCVRAYSKNYATLLRLQ